MKTITYTLFFFFFFSISPFSFSQNCCPANITGTTTGTGETLTLPNATDGILNVLWDGGGPYSGAYGGTDWVTDSQFAGTFPSITSLTGTLTINFGASGSCLMPDMTMLAGTGSVMCPYNNNVLPAELGRLKGTAKADYNLLTWETYEEINVDKIIIERSNNNNNWKPLGEVKARGGSGETNYYQFEDNNPFLLSYYRLRVVDFNGHEELSAVIVLTNHGQGQTLDIKVYPTNAQEEIYVEYNTIEEVNNNGQLTISLVNIHGQPVRYLAVDAQAGLTRINIKELASGIYFVNVGNGIERSITKIIKQ